MRTLVLASYLVIGLPFLEARVNPTSAQEREQTGRLRVGQSLEVTGSDASLTFEAVRSDSRCPKDARCIRAGEALVVLRWRVQRSEPAVLTFAVPPGGGAAQSAQGYGIQIVRLDPQAETDVEIAPGDYIATIAIRKQ